MSKSIDIPDFRNKSDKEKFDGIYTALTLIVDALQSLPSTSLGKNEARFWFNDGTPLPQGYKKCDGSNGTFDATTIGLIRIQKV